MLLDDGEELDGHAAGLFYATLPLLHRGLAGVEGAGKDRLADALALANPLDTAGIINTGVSSSQQPALSLSNGSCRRGTRAGPGGGVKMQISGVQSPDQVQT